MKGNKPHVKGDKDRHNPGHKYQAKKRGPIPKMHKTWGQKR